MTTTEYDTPVSAVVTGFEAKSGLVFKPSRAFYKRIGINKIRFWQLVKGEKEPVSSELVSLAKYFNVGLSELV